ncbi:MAG TPA: hypothetical protein DD412_04425 [Holosporales bacterium]|nr:hypothetical protein [Holosporales bacterium]
MTQKKPPQKKRASIGMTLKKTTKILLLFVVATLGSVEYSCGEESVNAEAIKTPEIISQEVDNSPTLQTCQTYVSDIETRFKGLKKPRSKLLFFRSVRAKKYQVVEKNIADFKVYVETKMTMLVGENAPQETKAFIKKCTDYYHILRDKILWIDNFRNKNLQYFANHTYADTFFKKQNNVINRKAPTHERKSYGYQK